MLVKKPLNGISCRSAMDSAHCNIFSELPYSKTGGKRISDGNAVSAVGYHRNNIRDSISGTNGRPGLSWYFSTTVRLCAELMQLAFT